MSGEGEPESVVFVLIDGVGDVGVPELGGRTPLQAARTPFLDAIAGECARVLLNRHALAACLRDPAALGARGGEEGKGGVGGPAASVHCLRLALFPQTPSPLDRVRNRCT